MGVVGDAASAPFSLPVAVPDEPGARLAMRRRFYERFGFGRDGTLGYGESELKFLEWEVSRGVLNPLNHAKPGSPWWREVNAALIRDAEMAAVLFDAKFDGPLDGAAGCWLSYIRQPSPCAWYRAHNSSIVSGYLSAMHLARLEPQSEQQFMNIVLYRVLYAQAMCEGAAPGLMHFLAEILPFGFVVYLERFLADPRWFSVDVIVRLPEFYPENYPATAKEMAAECGRSRWGNLLPESWFDDDLIGKRLSSLYGEAARWLGMPRLVTLLNGRNQPIYPRVVEGAAEGVLA